MKKLITCECGYKFEVGEHSKATQCFECIRKNKKHGGSKKIKPLDAAFKKIDNWIKTGKLK